MSDYTAAEVTTGFDDSLEWGDLAYKANGYKFALLVRDEPVVAEKVGGKEPAEGEGERVSIVVKIGDQFFEKAGYYASHYGTDWDGSVTEVRPQEKTVTVYEAV